jgi:hypothetical protein
VSPNAALRDLLPPGRRTSRSRVVAGVLDLLAAAAAATVAVTTTAGVALLPAGALVLLGIRLVGPWAVPATAATVGRPVGRLFGLPGSLARRNVARDPARTAATASALLVGVALLTMVSILFGSNRTAIAGEYQRYLADLQLDATAGTGIDPSAVDRLRALPQLSARRCPPDSPGGSTCCARSPASSGQCDDRPVRVDEEALARRAQPAGRGGCRLPDLGHRAWLRAATRADRHPRPVRHRRSAGRTVAGAGRAAADPATGRRGGPGVRADHRRWPRTCTTRCYRR